MRVGQLRTHKGWTIRELARRSGLSASYLSTFERGLEPNPMPKTLSAIADTFRWPDWKTLVASDELEPSSTNGHTREDLDRIIDQKIDERLRQRAVLGATPGPNQPIPVETTDAVIRVPIHAEVSAGRDRGERYRGYVEVSAAEAGKRQLGAVTVRGRCMAPYFLPGDLVIYEIVPDDQIKNGDLIVVTLLDEGEDGAFILKYLHWLNGDVRLSAEDGTERTVSYDRIKIEGRYWQMRRGPALRKEG